jgi:hypothetical protein
MRTSHRNGSAPVRNSLLTPVKMLQRLLRRLEKRMESLQRKLDGYRMVISELETEQDYLRRAIRYLEW